MCHAVFWGSCPRLLMMGLEALNDNEISPNFDFVYFGILPLFYFCLYDAHYGKLFHDLRSFFHESCYSHTIANETH